uniref:Uncharacterized protein n=1 Tax=Chromera velia CCMP2878 TaxID=1169474 RepID=A0A0G4H203_9ALVE|mmetsp:Transcript_40628/g.80056  ORF Transcript_40628/g.80056 Transcript_40628/m.80056 type:complete len:242 (+) Transcript_40628:202-927(+)|eukprot:Cvel_24376.t1-p1 / transcript=Cvel_24376.t1 / gene=Cvel_24376 / organism=Chromera_velia_CCMP2878 / gene_product=hypothetical protein / transcript_product=hypothetical protein / location=Cvel_scaffold2626:12429-13709(+) / protein_length=241 / sequence_SO=supercontig / SO=protein_coding / is_pseudo=false
MKTKDRAARELASLDTGLEEGQGGNFPEEETPAHTTAPPPVALEDDETRPGWQCNCCGGVRFLMTKRDLRLFLWKTAFVFVFTFALVPLIELENRIPGTVYAVFLIVLHLVILVIYFWRVHFRALDADWRSLTGRIVGLLASIALLYFAAKNEYKSNIGILCGYMFMLVIIHTLILALLTVRVRYRSALGSPHSQQDGEGAQGQARLPFLESGGERSETPSRPEETGREAVAAVRRDGQLV